MSVLVLSLLWRSRPDFGKHWLKLISDSAAGRGVGGHGGQGGAPGRGLQGQGGCAAVAGIGEPGTVN